MKNPAISEGGFLAPLRGSSEPPEWRLRDFAFAAYSGPNAPGLREASYCFFGQWIFQVPVKGGRDYITP